MNSKTVGTAPSNSCATWSTRDGSGPLPVIGRNRKIPAC